MYMHNLLSLNDCRAQYIQIYLLVQLLKFCIFLIQITYDLEENFTQIHRPKVHFNLPHWAAGYVKPWIDIRQSDDHHFS